MNFLGIPAKYSSFKNSKVVVIPFAYEATLSYGKGARFGPRAIILASQEVEWFDEDLENETYKIGIHTTKNIKPAKKQAFANLSKKVKEVVFQDKLPVILGGEHTTTYGGLLGVAEKYKDFSILHFDAHSDLRDIYEGNKFSHACVMRRALEIEQVKSIVQVGIRNVSSEATDGREFGFIKNNKNKIKIFWARDKDKWNIKNILKSLGKNVYISFDVDVLDPSIMPSTGTPEPGGLLWYETVNILKQVFKEKNVIGLDVVELSPIKNFVAPDFTIAKLIYKMIGYKYL